LRYRNSILSPSQTHAGQTISKDGKQKQKQEIEPEELRVTGMKAKKNVQGRQNRSWGIGFRAFTIKSFVYTKQKIIQVESIK
jgi:hypothetical protein